jgi:hypothetical protein
VRDSDGRPYTTPLLDLNFAYRICLEVARCALSHDFYGEEEWEEHVVRGGAKPSPQRIVSARRFRIPPFAIGFFWLVIGLGVFAENLAKYLKWSYITAWMVLFGIPCAILFKLSFRRIKSVEKTSVEETSRPTSITKEQTKVEAASIYSMRAKVEKSENEELSAGVHVREPKIEEHVFETSERQKEEPEPSLEKEKNVIITSESLESRQEDEFIDGFFLHNNHLKQSKDLFKHISAYALSYREKALESENLALFIRLLEKKKMMSGFTYQDIEGFVDFELRKVYEKERELRLREGKNLRKGGFGGTERASTW